MLESGETATGATRGASIDTYELDPSAPPRHTDARETGSLQVFAGDGRLALFEDGSLTFFDPSQPLSLQSPTAIVPPRTHYRPIVDFSANHVVFGVPYVESTADQYMGEVHVLSLGGAEAAVPFAGRAALFLLMVALLLVGALRSRPERKPA